LKKNRLINIKNILNSANTRLYKINYTISSFNQIKSDMQFYYQAGCFGSQLVCFSLFAFADLNFDYKGHTTKRDSSLYDILYNYAGIIYTCPFNC